MTVINGWELCWLRFGLFAEARHWCKLHNHSFSIVLRGKCCLLYTVRAVSKSKQSAKTAGISVTFSQLLSPHFSNKPYNFWNTTKEIFRIAISQFLSEIIWMWFTLNSFKNVSWSVPPCWKVCEKFLECLEHVSWTVLRLRCNLIKQCGFHDNLATHYIFLLSFFKYIDSQVHCRERSRFFFVGGAPPRMCNVNKFWKGMMKKEAYD